MKLQIKCGMKKYFKNKNFFRTSSNSSNSLTSKSIFSASNTNASAGVNMSTPAARNVYEKRSYNSATSLRTLATGVHAFSALLDNRSEPSEFEASVIMAATNADMNVLVNRNGSTSSSSSPSYQDFHQNANSTTNHELANQKNISISYFDNTNEMSCNEVIFNNPPNDSVSCILYCIKVTKKPIFYFIFQL